MVFHNFNYPFANALFSLPIAFLSLGLFIVWIWALIDCLVSELKTEDKLIWVLVIIVLNFVGAIIYFILAKKEKIKFKKGKKLFRTKDRVIAGVCGGIAEYFELDPTVVRLIWILVTIFTGIGTGIIAYILAWVIIPEK